MSYPFRVARIVAISGVALLLCLAGLLLTAQLLLPDVIRARVIEAIAAREDVRGGVEDIRVCTPCASYTLVGPDVEVRSEGEWKPVFSAGAVVVSLHPALPEGGGLVGAVRLDAPVFHFRGREDGGGGDGTDWSAIGRALSPRPIDRFDIVGGRVELSNPSLDPPVHWRISDVELTGTNVSRLAARPIAFDASGRMGGGRIAARVELPEQRGFVLNAELRGVSVTTFNDYLRNGLGVDVGSGSLDADGRVSASVDGNLEGVIQCRIDGLDLLELEDLATLNPLDALWESFAASTLAAAGSTRDGPLELEVEIEESVDDPGLNPWSLFGRVLRRSVWGLLESPATALRWLAQRANPLSQADAADD